MRIKFKWTLICLLIVSMFALFGAATATAEEPNYGGTLKFTSFYPYIPPMSWNNEDWNWKHGHDTGLSLEHLLSGDLQKGPRGTNEWHFQVNAWFPENVRRGELVESWEVKKDPLRMIFNLRKGVFWQERPGVMKSREFVADDVVYSMQKLSQSPKAIPTYVTFVDKWVAEDKYTVVAYLKEWNANWWYRFGMGYYDAIQPKEMYEAGAGKWENLCGTGPYALKEYKTAASVTWEKNPNYWDSTQIDGKSYKLPFTDGIKEMLIADESTRISQLRAGKLDLMMSINWKYKDSLAKTNPDLKWKKWQWTGGYMLAMRMDTKPFDDIRVRRALNLAINQQEIVDNYYQGNAELIGYPYPPNFGDWHTPLKDLPPDAQELYTYNPEKAKKLLAEAGYPDGFSFKCQVNSSGGQMLEVAQICVAYLSKIGVKMEIEPMPYSQYMSMMIKKKHGPVYFFSNDHGNPFATIRKNFVTGQTWNPYMMSDKKVDETFFRLVSDADADPADVKKQLKELNVYCLSQAPAVWLPIPYNYAAWWPWVKNYYGELRDRTMNQGAILSRIWIDEALKKKMGY